MPALTDTCPECGFRPPTVSPSDSAVAARSYPRRWRGLLVRPDDDDPDVVRREPAPGEPSALALAAHAASTLAAVADALERVRVEEAPLVSVLLPPPERAGALEDELAHLRDAAERFATAVERYQAEEWELPARLAGDGGTVRAIDVARHGVHTGIHDLRAAERVIDLVR